MFDSLMYVACSSGRQWTTVQWRKEIRKHPFWIATFFLCSPQAGAKPAKEQLKLEEPEANTSASTEALQKAFQPVCLTAQFYGNAVHPVNTPSWTTRLQIAFLFPKLTKEQQEMLMEKKLKQLEQQPPTSK
jgi:hypothetical protein